MKTAHRSLIGGVVLIVVFTGAACGTKVEGTYSDVNGLMILELKSDGKADFTLMGDKHPCIYKADGTQLSLDCSPNGEKWVLTIHDDGSLTGPFVGALRKSN
jgi:hypothetical protein